MADKEYKIGVSLEGAKEAADELERLDKAAGGVNDKIDESQGKKPAWADAQPAKETADAVGELGDKIEGTGTAALGLDGKVGGLRERLATLKDAASEAAGGGDAGGEGFGALFPTFAAAGEKVDDLGSKLIDMAGGPITIAITAVTALAGAWLQVQKEMEATIDSLEKAGDRALKAVDKIKQATQTEEEKAAQAQPERAEEFRDLAGKAADRLLSLNQARRALNDPNAEADTIAATMGGDAGIDAALDVTGGPEYAAIRNEQAQYRAAGARSLSPSEIVATNPLMRARARQFVEGEIERNERLGSFNVDRFQKAEKAGGGEADDIREVRSRIASLDRSAGSGGNDEMKAEIARLKADVEALLSRERTNHNNGPAVNRNR